MMRSTTTGVRPIRLVLASGSPRRAELLDAAGFEFEVLAPDIDERLRPGEPSEAYVRRLASEKSAAAQACLGASRSDDVVVIGADTAVVIDGDILGKPADAAEARRMLKRIAGRAHLVVTGVSVRRGVIEEKGAEITTVWFSSVSDRELDWYVESAEGADKAGAYAIQGLASRFVARIDGSYSNVVGLPVAMVSRLIKSVNTEVIPIGPPAQN
jgi:septum formation protein